MTLRNLIVSAFDGVTLHDGSTYYAVGYVDEISRPLTQIITLPDGTKYDSTPTGTVAPLVPGAITTETVIKGASKAANQTAFATIAAKVGHHGTLTVKEVNSATTYTANARMTGVRNMTPLQAGDAVGYLRIWCEFELLEALS